MPPEDVARPDLDAKTGRLAALAQTAGVAGILLSTPPNFAWLTDGATNRIDISRDTGAGHLLVRQDGARFLLANATEQARFACDAALTAAFEPVTFTWTEERSRSGWLTDLAARLCGPGPVGSDAAHPGTVRLDAAMAAARLPLLPDETARLRAFGAEAGAAAGTACRATAPGVTESEIAGRVAGALIAIGAQPLVLLVGSDERLQSIRHPLPTTARWQRVVLVSMCVERDGLVVALSRMMTAGPAAAALREDIDRAGRVFGALVAGTRAGRPGSDLFAIARAAWAAEGRPGEERHHHLGGAIGYRSRDWVAHPGSADRVVLPGAFAWNPTLPGAKVEDTVLFTTAGAEIITTSPDWPSSNAGSPESLRWSTVLTL